MNYTGKRLELPSGEKTVRVEIEAAHDDKTVFRFGYVAEAFKPT